MRVFRGWVLTAWLAAGILPCMADEPVYPGKTWAAAAPAEAALDEAKLAALAEHVGGRGCVVRHGRMVYTWGRADKRGDIASASKPFYAHLLLRALEDGRIPSLDEPVVRHEPRLGRINAELGHKDRLITWRHLATQTSCYGVAEEPGEAYCYNDWQMALFWDLLFLKVYGATYQSVDRDVLGPLLTDALQCEDGPTMMAFGTDNRPGRVAISPRDFARFGLLYLRRGQWRGHSLLSPEHVAMLVGSPLPNSLPQARSKTAQMLPDQRSHGSTRKPDNQTDHLGSYSFLWWTNGLDRHDRRLWPGVPEDVFGAFGHSGVRAMAVMPSLDIVVSWNDARWGVGAKEHWTHVAVALRLLAGAATDEPDTIPASEPKEIR